MKSDVSPSKADLGGFWKKESRNREDRPHLDLTSKVASRLSLSCCMIPSRGSSGKNAISMDEKGEKINLAARRLFRIAKLDPPKIGNLEAVRRRMKAGVCTVENLRWRDQS